MRLFAQLLSGCLLLSIFAPTLAQMPERQFGPPLAGTRPLEMDDDIASKLVDGVDRFLLQQTELAAQQRETFWQRDTKSEAAYEKSIAKKRAKLGHLLGVRDPRHETIQFQRSTAIDQPAILATSDTFDVLAVRWPVCGEIEGEGLLLLPKGEIRGNVIAIPDASQTPEQLVGLEEGIPEIDQFARRLAENGIRVIVPTVISRERGLLQFAGPRQSQLPGRELLYRSAFELGRHLIGYEVQKVLAAVDAFEAANELPIGVIGYGEGGLLAFYSAALDTRLKSVAVSGYFGPRETLWQQPIDRNVFGLLNQFGDSQVASMIAPRTLIIEDEHFATDDIPGQHGSAPGKIVAPERTEVVKEWKKALDVVRPLTNETWSTINGSPQDIRFGKEITLLSLLEGLPAKFDLKPPGKLPKYQANPIDPTARMVRQMQQIDQFNQRLLRESTYARKAFFQPDTSSLEAFEESVAPYRETFAQETIGQFDLPRLPANARSRQAYRTDQWTAYEVVLDVFPEVIAYGLLILPNDLKEEEQRPVVVCQHGLEGRPRDLIGEEKHAAYKAYAGKLAERGFITFCPQNLYIFTDRFRSLQRKANPLGKTLFSIIIPQHQQIVSWLKEQPFVDPERIAFYGLSYGGKSAMRIPPLVPEYCAVICSGDFNEWIDKNASTRNPRSYIWTGEYEIFEFDLGSTFGYAEMAGLIAPRPFMVERGHFDGVADDETVAYEFAKVRHLYAARLHLPDRCEIEWFDGPHTINGEATFDFLHRHLNWPKPE
ncbi:hypothetical protein DTL21_06670 [Bremerella cremea]|uniref:Dienelactone hydrolase domain-containing protein n=1 Tax=Blastopirellula marina TaxID=124 RepID=A0A2S8FZL4_9BACT|nr:MULTISPECIES: dienelactone hydrolase family protein [Pirellulaceae]PQO37623.1 hypothetical protein C5Y83_06670 [Blastopirellula marina]RCS50010.1 hypothetical protein DTL21_06670 [Bremerella cremea]